MVMKSKKKQQKNSNNNKSRRVNYKKTNKNKIDLSKLAFKSSDILGEGAYSKVYKFRYNKQISNKYVVKRIKLLFLKKFYGKNANQEIITLFNNELRALIHLSKVGLSPKIYGIYSDIENNKLYYVLEKLDYTLGSMLRSNNFKPKHTQLIIELLKNMLKTRYRHTDLHIENIMFNKKKNKFVLIDFGHHTELSKKNSEGYFTEISGKPDKLLIDKRKGYSNAVLGTSGASALSAIYKFLVLKTLDNNTDAFIYLGKLKKFIRSATSKKDYLKIILALNQGIGL